MLFKRGSCALYCIAKTFKVALTFFHLSINAQSVLNAGTCMQKGDFILSTNGCYKLIF